MQSKWCIKKNKKLDFGQLINYFELCEITIQGFIRDHQEYIPAVNTAMSHNYKWNDKLG